MFDPDKLTREVEKMAILLDDIAIRIVNLENAVFAAAGTGPTQETGAVADDLKPQTIDVKAGDVGNYSDVVTKTTGEQNT